MFYVSFIVCSVLLQFLTPPSPPPPLPSKLILFSCLGLNKTHDFKFLFRYFTLLFIFIADVHSLVFKNSKQKNLLSE
jgi:hypothetical protein